MNGVATGRDGHHRGPFNCPSVVFLIEVSGFRREARILRLSGGTDPIRIGNYTLQPSFLVLVLTDIDRKSRALGIETQGRRHRCREQRHSTRTKG